MTDDDEHVSVGVEIQCHPDVRDEILSQLRDAVGEILDGYSDEEVSDYGIG
jgi:hypothetical protein